MLACTSECNGPESDSLGSEFDDLYEALGLPELKGFSESPAPEPVDESRIRNLLQGTLDSQTSQRLYFLIANYREWSGAFTRIRDEQATNEEGQECDQ